MSRFLIGNVFLFCSMILAVGSQLLIKALIDEVRPSGLELRQLLAFGEGDRLLRGGLAAAMVVAGFICWLLCLVRLDLSYAYPVVCSSVLLVAIFSVLFVGETMTVRTWCATLLILLGLILLTSAKGAQS